MKAISLTEPWAFLVAVQAKRLETRSWPTRYRGPLAIHAAKGFPRDAISLCFEEPFATFLRAHEITTPAGLPRGVIVATCTLRDCIPTVGLFGELQGLGWVSDHEDAFGDFSEGRFAWVLDDVKRLDPPVPARGSLGLWDWDEAST